MSRAIGGVRDEGSGDALGAQDLSNTCMAKAVDGSNGAVGEEAPNSSGTSARVGARCWRGSLVLLSDAAGTARQKD